MISINEHIRYLLLRNDCVIVPGLGAFIAQSGSARYDEEKQLFMPPYRTVGFNSSISHDDGELASSIVRREGVSYETARTLIANEVAMLRSRLDGSASAIIPRLGVLQRSGSGIVFEPESAAAIADARYMGLEPVSVAAAAMPAAADDESTPVLEVPALGARRHLRWMRVAASVALLLGLGFALSTPVLVDRTGLQYASVGVPKVIKGVEPVKIAPVDTVGRSLFCAIPDSAQATGRVVIAKPLAPETVKPAAAEPMYAHYLIVGSCNTLKGANRFIARHASDNLKVVKGDGYYRVYIKAGNTQAEVEAPRTAVAQRYPGAWIYSR